MSQGLSLRRMSAILRKEFIQMRRDRLTFAMMIGVPILQLILFGYAINTDPRHLPTLVELRDDGPAVRAILSGLEASEFFRIEGRLESSHQAKAAFASGEALFVVTFPEGFERDLARGDRPQVLLDVDATDPVAAAAGIGAFPQVIASALQPLMASVAGAPSPPWVEAVAHRRYNPAGRNSTNIVPGLLGVVLTMTMTLMTSIALTRETERGTLETLLASPARPAEVMLGKIAPFVLVGLVQVGLMLALAYGLFGIPPPEKVGTFAMVVALFVLVNLLIGFLFSTIARTQMQAFQMTFFFFLPSILLSGFMFPFAGMPSWAQVIGQLVPTTHFNRAARAVVLKGAGTEEVSGSLAALGIMLVVVSVVAVVRYRRTLD